MPCQFSSCYRENESKWIEKINDQKLATENEVWIRINHLIDKYDDEKKNQSKLIWRINVNSKKFRKNV